MVFVIRNEYKYRKCVGTTHATAANYLNGACIEIRKWERKKEKNKLA